MQIHELNTKALTDPAYVPFDDGTDTYKADFKEVIDDAVAEAFSSADVSGGVVDYTSGDSSSPSSWTDVSVMSSGSTLATLMNRISTMVKNVRYLWSLIGSSSITNVSSTITEAIGNTSITGIGNGTVTGAISALNGNSIIAVTADNTISNIAADGSGSVDVPISLPSGYSAVGASVAQISSQNRFVVWCGNYANTFVRVMYLNHRTGAATVTVRVTVYAKR